MHVVVDVNVLAYFWLPGPLVERAIAVREATDDWHVPPLWRSEFRNLLSGYLRRGDLNLAQACALMRTVEATLFDYEESVDSLDVLRLVAGSDCSAYDCEYVALAEHLNVPLVTEDRALLRNFPDRAVQMAGVL